MSDNEKGPKNGFYLPIKIKKLDPNATIPVYAKSGDAGLDLTVVSIEEKNEFISYGSGLAIEIPKGFVGLMFPRSSITKANLMLKNSVGIIDSGYRGEIMGRFKKVKFEDGKQEAFYQIGDKFAQLIIIPRPYVVLQEVEELSETERGASGFGSTGK